MSLLKNNKQAEVDLLWGKERMGMFYNVALLKQNFPMWPILLLSVMNI